MATFTNADRIGGIGGYIGGISALLGNGGLMGGYSEGDRPVSRYEIDMLKESMAKDSEIALLKSEQNTEIKIADVYARLKGDMLTMERNQNDINAAQAVYNATNSSAVAVLNSQVAQLMSLTALHIPAEKVCPTPMPQFNSWVAPT